MHHQVEEIESAQDWSRNRGVIDAEEKGWDLAGWSEKKFNNNNSNNNSNNKQLQRSQQEEEDEEGGWNVSKA